MTARSTNNNKITRLYEGLTETERVRMLAKLARTHDPAEMERLRTATPMAHAGAYNRALRLLRVLNGNLVDWISIFRTGMERDRFRLQAFLQEGVTLQRQWDGLWRVWKLIPYPITESEYRALIDRARAQLWSLDDYAIYLVEGWSGDESELHPDLAAVLQNLPPELEYPQYPDPDTEGAVLSKYEAWQAIPVAERVERAREEGRITDAIATLLRLVIDAAITRGELPKPRRKGGALSLPIGTLETWSQGEPDDRKPAFYVPAIQLLGGELAEWDIRPDSDAEAVRDRRKEMRNILVGLAGIRPEDHGALPTFDPPLTDAEHAQATKDAAALGEHWPYYDELAERVLDAANAHASFRAQLEGLTTALAIIQREDFNGEDPLWEEIRTLLDDAHEEAKLIHTLWTCIDGLLMLRAALRKSLGMAPTSYAEGIADDPIPLPSQEPETEHFLPLIREWGM